MKEVDNFKYLGSWILSREKDMNIKNRQAWVAISKMMKMRKSNL